MWCSPPNTSTSRHTSAKWCRPRALGLLVPSGWRYVARMRSRSASMAATSISVMGCLSDPEEEVEIAVGDRPVTSDRPRVAPAERRQHEAAGVELEDGQVVDVAGGVREALLADRDAGVSGVGPGRDADAHLAGVGRGDGVGGVLPQHEHERRE